MTQISSFLASCQTNVGLCEKELIGGTELTTKVCILQVIAAKQADCIRAPAFGAAYVPKEGAMCIDLDHPNVMATFKMVTENAPGEHPQALDRIPI